MSKGFDAPVFLGQVQCDCKNAAPESPPLYTVEPITAVHGVFVWSLLFPHPAQGIAPQHIDLQVLNAGRLVSAGILLSFLRFSYLRRPF